MKKSIKNADIVAYKLEPASTKVTNYNLEVTKKERRKREEIVERQKIEAIAAECKRARGGISLFSEEEKNYESNIKDKTNLDQINNEYLLQL